MPQVVRDILFQGLAAPLRLVGADAVLSLLSEIVVGWPFRATQSDPSAQPFFTISSVSDSTKLCCESHVEDRAPQFWDPVNAACDAMAALAMAVPLSDPRLICLHAAGVEMAGRLAIFPNIRRAGKSTLSAALARAGHRVFSDDVVPLSFLRDGRAVAHAMGLAPRLRLPLPQSLPHDFRVWAEAVPGPRNRQYHYLPLAGHPKHGTRLPVGAFVLLDRRDEPSAARLTLIAPDAAMDALLHQNFTRDRHSGEVLDVIAGVLAVAPVWQLTYSELDDAVACLQAGFAEWDDPAPRTEGEERRFRPAVLDAPPAQPDPLLAQRDGRVQRWIGETLYLADPEGRAIQRMDPLAAAIWGMLDEPLLPEELEETLREAFPGTPRDQIGADLRALLDGLADAGLVGHPKAAQS